MRTTRRARKAKTLEVTEEIHLTLRREALARGLTLQEFTGRLLTHALRMRKIDVDGAK